VIFEYYLYTFCQYARFKTLLYQTYLVREPIIVCFAYFININIEVQRYILGACCGDREDNEGLASDEHTPPLRETGGYPGAADPLREGPRGVSGD